MQSLNNYLERLIVENDINESLYNSLLDEIENLIGAENAEEFNTTFEIISSMLQEMEQTVTFSGNKISNLEPKSFHCSAIRYDDVNGDAPRFHGGCVGEVTIGPGMGKVAQICYNNYKGGDFDKTGGAFVVVNSWGGGFKKDLFMTESTENSIRCLGPDKDIKSFVKSIM